MNNSFEILKARQLLTAPESVKKVSSFDALKQRKDVTVSKGEPLTATPQSEVKGGFAGEILTGSTQRFGKTAGEALAAPGNADKFSESLESHTKIQSDLIKAIKAKKVLGQDTSRLENALQNHTESTPKLEDFTGDVVNKTAGQVLGEAGGTLLEATSGGILGKGTSTLASKTLSLGDKVKEGAKIGATYGAIGGGTQAMQEGAGVAGTLKSAGVGAVVGGASGGGIGTIGGLASRRAASKVATAGERNIGKIEKATGEILQGEKADVKKGIKIISNLDTKGVKTYEELNRVLDKKIETLSTAQDTHLDLDKTQRKLSQLSGEIKVGDKIVKHNYVNDALTQLQQFYKKTNNIKAEQEMLQLRAKAVREGLTNKELNSLAKLHGRDLNGFNANGELASGLTKQSAENTRKGLKSTLRTFTKDEISKQIDDEISQTIKVRDLTTEMERKVNILQQKIQPYTMGQKIGRGVLNFLDFFTGGGLKGAISAALPRGVGYKVLNALDLEENLQKNLKILQKIENIIDTQPKETVLEKINKLLNKEVYSSQESSASKLSAAMRPAAITNKRNTITRIKNNTISDTIAPTAKGVKGLKPPLNLAEDPVKAQRKLDRVYDSEINALANRSSVDDMAFGNFEKERVNITKRIYGESKLLEEKQALLKEIQKLKKEVSYSTDETAQRMVKAREKSISIIDNELSKKAQGEIPKTIHHRIEQKGLNFKQYTKEHIEELDKKLLSNKNKAVIIDSDEIKKFHPDYDPKNTNLLHEESSALSKVFLEKAIDEDVSGVFRMTGGGSGSGKSEITLSKLSDKPSVVFDGTLSNKGSAKQKIDYALSKGKKVELHPTYTPVELAQLWNQMRTRTVPTPVLAESHFGFRQTLPELLAEYGNKIKIIPYENKKFGIKAGGLMPINNLMRQLESFRLGSEEVLQKAQFIEDHIKEYGIDFTKSIINDII